MKETNQYTLTYYLWNNFKNAKDFESFRITLNPCGFIHKNYNGAPVRAEVSHL